MYAHHFKKTATTPEEAIFAAQQAFYTGIPNSQKKATLQAMLQTSKTSYLCLFEMRDPQHLTRIQQFIADKENLNLFIQLVDLIPNPLRRYDVITTINETYNPEPRLNFSSAENTNADDLFFEFLNATFPFSAHEPLMKILYTLQEDFRSQLAQNYFIDSATTQPALGKKLIDPLVIEPLLLLRIQKFLQTLFTFTEALSYKYMSCGLFFSLCYAAANDTARKYYALPIAKSLITALIEDPGNVAPNLQQNLMVSFLSLYTPRGRIPGEAPSSREIPPPSSREIPPPSSRGLSAGSSAKKTEIELKTCFTQLMSASSNEQLALNHDAVGNALIEYCQRQKKSLSWFFSPMPRDFSISKCELIIKTVVDALSQKPRCTENTSTELLLEKDNKEIAPWIEHPNQLFYLHLVIQAFPAENFLVAINQQLQVVDTDIQLKYPLIACQIILLKKKYRPNTAILNAQPQNSLITIFTNYFRELNPEAHAYYLAINGARAYIHLLCQINSSPLAIELVIGLFFVKEIPLYAFTTEDQVLLQHLLSRVFNRFSVENIRDLLTCTSQKPRCELFIQALLPTGLRQLTLESPLTTKNMLSVLTRFWETPYGLPCAHNLIQTLQQLSVAEPRAHQKIIILLTTCIQCVDTIENSKKILNTFFTTLTTQPKASIAVYHEFYHSFLKTYPPELQQEIIPPAVKPSLTGLFARPPYARVFKSIAPTPKNAPVAPEIT